MTATTATSRAPGASGNAAGTLAERLAGWVAQLTYEAIPAEAAETAKLLGLDKLGLQLSGASLPNVAGLPVPVRKGLLVPDAQRGRETSEQDSRNQQKSSRDAV
jgi:hypothetical protein